MAARLTDRQQRIVSEYLIDLNATQAAIRAGYSKKTADRIGPELLGKTCVSEAIQAAKDARSKRTEITQDRVLEEYARIAFFDPRKMFDADGNPLNISELDDDTAAAVAGLEVIKEFDSDTGVTSYTKKYKIANKLGALDSVAKHLGMLNGTFGAPKDEENEDALSQSLKEMAKELESDD